MTTLVTCQCGQSFKASERVAGRTVPCPKCKEPIVIPPLEDISSEPEVAAPFWAVGKPAPPADPFANLAPAAGYGIQPDPFGAGAYGVPVATGKQPTSAPDMRIRLWAGAAASGVLLALVLAIFAKAMLSGIQAVAVVPQAVQPAASSQPAAAQPATPAPSQQPLIQNPAVEKPAERPTVVIQTVPSKSVPAQPERAQPIAIQPVTQPNQSPASVPPPATNPPPAETKPSIGKAKSTADLFSTWHRKVLLDKYELYTPAPLILEPNKNPNVLLSAKMAYSPSAADASALKVAGMVLTIGRTGETIEELPDSLKNLVEQHGEFKGILHKINPQQYIMTLFLDDKVQLKVIFSNFGFAMPDEDVERCLRSFKSLK